MSNGRHGDAVDENERDLRSADVVMTLIDGPVNFHVLLSKISLRGPALLPRRQTRASTIKEGHSHWVPGCRRREVSPQALFLSF